MGAAIGISAATNLVQKTVEAYVSGGKVTAATGVTLSATEMATITALTIGGAIAAGVGGGAGVGVGGAGAGSANTVKDTVEAVITNGSTVLTTGGNVGLTATDTAMITANGGGVGIALGVGVVGVGVSAGVGYANNDIEDQVRAFIDGSSVTAAGAVNVSATEKATIQSFTIGGAVSAAGGGIVGVALAGAGRWHHRHGEERGAVLHRHQRHDHLPHARRAQHRRRSRLPHRPARATCRSTDSSTARSTMRLSSRRPRSSSPPTRPRRFAGIALDLTPSGTGSAQTIAPETPSATVSFNPSNVTFSRSPDHLCGSPTA